MYEGGSHGIASEVSSEICSEISSEILGLNSKDAETELKAMFMKQSALSQITSVEQYCAASLMTVQFKEYLKKP